MANIYCFGDSITQGMWDANGGWADRIKQYIHADKLKNMQKTGIAVFNFGVSSDLSSDVLRRLPQGVSWRAKNEFDPHNIFIVAVGLNDTYAHKTRDNVVSTPKEYRKNLANIAEYILARSKNLIFVGPTPVVEEKTHINTRDYLYWNERIAEFNEVLSSFCSEKGLKFIEVFDEMQQLDGWEDIFPDGVHPNTDGHEWMFGRILPEVQKMLDS